MGAHTERSGVLDPAICWQAIYSRDARFDGRFFAGATTTGLYCRNVCPVPFARPKNIVLFACAAAAESAGFRPCKRCQPQAVPGTPAWVGTSAVVARALRLILGGALNEGRLEELAEKLGLGPRQLRRLFGQHLGTSPLKIASAHRVQLAGQLIRDSKLSMTEIAFHAGFQSIREFNHAMRLATGRSPSELRRAPVVHSNGLVLRLPYRPPLAWDSLLSFLAERAVPGVEVVSGRSYQRTIEVGGAQGFFTATADPEASRLVVQLELSSYAELAPAVERIRRIFDLAADPVRIDAHLSRDPALRPSIERRPGLRVPGAWSAFEAALLAQLGQSLTSPGSRSRAAQLVRKFGKRVDTPILGLHSLFPQADAFGGALGGLTKVDESAANYIAMRAFGEPDAFPGTGAAEEWRPWRAYAAMHLATAA